MTSLERSYAFCRAEAKSKARNFYYSFVLLPREKRDAMCAIYAFMRHCDDLSDEPDAAPEALAGWRAELICALAGRFGAHPCWPAFSDTVVRYRIPHEYFHQMIDGVSSDLEARRLRTFQELYEYCYRVASVVGLTTIHIFGYESPRALKLAESCGVAFQLTNILRDVKEDLARGRVYLPLEDLDRFGVRSLDDGRTPAFLKLARFEGERARRLYDASRELVSLVHPDSRRALWALMEIYRRLLDRIDASDYDVFTRRIRLRAWEKLAIVAKAAAGVGTKN